MATLLKKLNVAFPNLNHLLMGMRLPSRDANKINKEIPRCTLSVFRWMFQPDNTKYDYPLFAVKPKVIFM